MVSRDVLSGDAEAWLAGTHLLRCWLYDEDQRFVDTLWSRPD
jgi:hypothetical protein